MRSSAGSPMGSTLSCGGRGENQPIDRSEGRHSPSIGPRRWLTARALICSNGDHRVPTATLRSKTRGISPVSRAGRLRACGCVAAQESFVPPPIERQLTPDRARAVRVRFVPARNVLLVVGVRVDVFRLRVKLHGKLDQMQTREHTCSTSAMRGNGAPRVLRRHTRARRPPSCSGGRLPGLVIACAW
jgi:hypothetical protein